MKKEKTCQYCNSFFMTTEEWEPGFGVCLRDEAFAPCIEEIFDSGTFSSCYDLYLQKRVDGAIETCSHFEEVKIIEIESLDDPDDI